MATQWGRIKAEYLKGGVTYQELAEKYHLSVKTIQNRSSNEGWAKEKGTIQEEVGKAIRERTREEKINQLEKLIEINADMIEAVEGLVAAVKATPNIMLGEKNDAKAADSITRAIACLIQNQRDLHKIPTLDQDFRKREAAQRKRETKFRQDIEKAKLELEKAKQTGSESTGILWNIHVPEGEEDLDG